VAVIQNRDGASINEGKVVSSVLSELRGEATIGNERKRGQDVSQGGLDEKNRLQRWELLSGWWGFPSAILEFGGL